MSTPVLAAATLTRQRSLADAAAAGVVVRAASATLTRERTLSATAHGYARPANDDFANAQVMAGLTGTTTFETIGATVEVGEPVMDGAVGPVGTVWFQWSPGVDADAVISALPLDPAYATTLYGPSVEVFVAGATMADLVPAGGSLIRADGGGTVAIRLRASESYYIRAYSVWADLDAVLGFTLDWTATDTTIDLTLPVAVLATPGVLSVNVANEPAGESIDFTVDGDLTVRGNAVTDADGAASYVSVVLPEITDGAHLLIARGEAGRTGNVAFTVSSTDYHPPVMPPPPVAPSAPVTPARWQFEDPTTTAVWAFPINPNDADSVMLARTLQVFETTAVVGGQHLVFEGGQRAKTWTFKGELFTLADVEALKAWRLPYRVYVTDDLGRVLIVKLLKVASTPVRDVRRPEHHAYVATALLYGRVMP